MLETSDIKIIQDLLEKQSLHLTGEIEGLRSDLTQKYEGGLSGLRTDLTGKIEGLRSDLTQKITDTAKNLKEEIVEEVGQLLETSVLPQIAENTKAVELLQINSVTKGQLKVALDDLQR